MNETVAPSIETAQGASEPRPSDATTAPRGKLQAVTQWQIAWGPVLLLAALIILLYHRVAVKLVTDWAIPDYSHGYLIPFFAAYVVWDKRDALRRTPLVPTWAGLWLVVIGLFELLVGIFGADLFFQRTSFILLAIGLVWTLLGKKMLGELKFVLFVMVLAIPLPTILFNQITFPLQLFASRIASEVLPWFGVPVLQEGNVINLPAMPLEVAEACSGIRSLMSLFAVAVIFGYLFERSTPKRVLLALCSIPIAIAANVARIVGTGLCVQYWDPQKALGFFHEFSGLVMFVVSLICLYGIHSAMSLVSEHGSRSA